MCMYVKAKFLCVYISVWFGYVESESIKWVVEK